MHIVEERPLGEIAKLRTQPVPALVNGDCLDADEFLRRYEAMSEDFKAELIDGIVYVMLPLVSIQFHGEPDFEMHGWLTAYKRATPGVKGATNSTARLNIKNVPQPDAMLRLLPEFGGASSISEKGYLSGPPELVVEISNTSAGVDVGKKKEAYRLAGIPEYIVWLAGDPDLKWWTLKDGQYVLLQPDKDGILKSQIFPGLWLDAKALLADDSARVFEVLEMGLKSKEHGEFVKKLKGSAK